MAGVSFFLGCSAKPIDHLNLHQHHSRSSSAAMFDHQDDDDLSITDKYETVDPDGCPDLRNTHCTVPLALSPTIVTSISKTKISSAAASIPRSSNLTKGLKAHYAFFSNPSPDIDEMSGYFDNNDGECHQPPSPLMLADNLRRPPTPLTDSEEEERPLSSSLSDLEPYLRMYQNVRIVDDEYVQDRFLGERPILADPEKPFIACTPVYESVAELLAVCYPFLKGEEYRYHMDRLENNRQQMTLLREQVEHEYISSRRPSFVAQTPVRRSRVKLH